MDHDDKDRLPKPFMSYDQIDALNDAGLTPAQTYGVLLAATRAGSIERQTGEQLPPGVAVVNQEWVAGKARIDPRTLSKGFKLAEQKGLVSLVSAHRRGQSARWDFSVLLKSHKGKENVRTHAPEVQEPNEEAKDSFEDARKILADLPIQPETLEGVLAYLRSDFAENIAARIVRIEKAAESPGDAADALDDLYRKLLADLGDP